MSSQVLRAQLVVAEESYEQAAELGFLPKIPVTHSFIGHMPDFLAAARRHLDDGDFLHQNSRHSNAVQLWAYGGECTLKAIALKQGHTQVGQNSRPTQGFALHLNQIKDGLTLLSLYNAKQTGTNALMGPETSFVGWDINARYEDGAQLLSKLDEYRNDARCFRKMLNDSTLREGPQP